MNHSHLAVLKSIMVVWTFIFTASVNAQEFIKKYANRVNEAIYTIDVDETNDLIYVGGDFTRAGNFGQFGAVLDPTTGLVPEGFPRVDGDVLTSISDGEGGYFIGGNFTAVGDAIRKNIAHININGTVTSFGKDLNINGPVHTLALSAATLYVGGSFTSVNDSYSDSGGACINLGDGLPKLNFQKVNGTVEIAIPDGAGGYYLGGQFTLIGDSMRNRIAHLGASGSVKDWNPMADGTVHSLALFGNTVYAGGDFTSVGGAVRNKIAALNAVDGLATSWDPDANGTIHSLVVSNNTVYVGGNFTNIGGENRNNIAAIRISNGLATGWNPNANRRVLSLAVSGDTIFAGGEFFSIGGESRSRLAALQISDGLAVNWNPNPDGTILSIAVSGSTVYAGGSFAQIGGETRNRLAAFRISDGSLTSWDPSANSRVEKLVVVDDLVYVGGHFTRIGEVFDGVSRRYIAAISTDSGMATSWNPNAENRVLALAVSDGIVYAGGSFRSIGGADRDFIAAINSNDGLATDWNPDANGQVFDLAVADGIVYAGGTFNIIGAEGGALRNHAGALFADSGIATPWNPNADGRVTVLAVSENTVYAGGDFTRIGEKARNYIGEVDRINGLATDWDPNANALVDALAVSGDLVYAGGGFNRIGGETRNHLAALNISDGLAVDWDPNANGTVRSLIVFQGTVFAGGNFDRVVTRITNQFIGLTPFLLKPDFSLSVPQIKSYGDPDFLLNASSSNSLGNISLFSSDETIIKLTGNMATITGAGEATLSARLAETETYLADSLGQTITVTKAMLTAGVEDVSRVFGIPNPDFDVVYSGFVNTENSEVLNLTPVVTTKADENSDVASYTLTVSGGSANNYDFQYIPGTLTVTPAPAEVSLSNLEQRVDGTPKMPTVNTDPTGLNTIITYDGTPNVPTSAGNYQVIATIDELNYEGNTTGTFILSDVLLSLDNNADAVRVYPNPTSKKLQIAGVELSKVVIHSMDGKAYITSNQNEIDLGALTQGVYVVTLYGKSGKIIYQQRLIKN